MHPDWQNQIHVYCENHSSSEPEVLQKLTQFTWRKTVNPRQLSGHLQGRFLSHLVHTHQPKKILEIGTFTGYATYCLAENARNEPKSLPLKPTVKSHINVRNFGKITHWEVV